jgi:uncharacterized protein involved in exopolysaccharide biosynthesis
MSSSVDDYVTRLEQQLRQRSIVDWRMLAEAREHLIDDIEDGRQRGLSIADAEREAMERFGAPEIVAAQVLEERGRMRTGFGGMFATMWQRKWWIVVPTVLAAAVTGVTSYNFQPVRYQAHTTILVVPQRVSPNYVPPSVTTTIGDRLRTINQQIRSRAHLERIVEELNLYPERRKKDGMQDIVDDMSDDIAVEVIQGDVFRVAFTTDSPRTAQQVAERLAGLVIDEALTDSTVMAEATTDFIDSQIEVMREQILAQEKYLEALRVESRGRSLSQAYLIPYETLKESYKALLAKQQDAALAASLQRRQIGDQFRILDAARLPEEPVGPSRFRTAVMGALVGLVVGLVLVLLGRSPNTRPPTLAEA